MYKNYGDHDFFERGRLVDTEHSDTVIDVLYCNPYPDEEGLYQFAVLAVDLEDSFIDRDAVMKYSGLEPPYDPVDIALEAVDYYGPECFGACDMAAFGVEWSRMDRESILNILKHRMTDCSDVVFE